MKKTLFSIAAILCASLVLFSCTKDHYYPDDSSQALTSLFKINPSQWAATSAGNFELSLNVDEITSSVTDQGAVWIYFSYDGGYSYELAPSLSIIDDNDNTFDFLAKSGDDDQGGYVTLTALPYSGNTNQKPGLFFDEQLRVKVVSIPSQLYQANKNVDKTNYNEVKRVFRLK